MKPRLLNSKLALAILGGLLLISGTVVPTRYTGPIARPFTATLTYALQVPAHPLKAMADRLAGPQLQAPSESALKIREDRDLLLVYTRQLEQEKDRLEQEVRELQNLRQLGPNPTPGQADHADGPVFLIATVTAWSDTGHNPVLTINRGLSSGVQNGLVVVSGPNLVGQIADAHGAYSIVRLITTPRTHLTVEVLPPVPKPARRGHILVEAAGNLHEFYADSLNHPEQYHDNEVAYLNDDRWPYEAAGRVVGRVVRIEPDPRQPLSGRRLVIQPEERFDTLRQVVVILPARAGGAGGAGGADSPAGVVAPRSPRVPALH